MREDLGCSTAQLAGGLSLARSTLAGIPVGRCLDRHPPRSMMLAGSVLAPAWLLETVERRERAPKTIVEQIRRKRRELPHGDRPGRWRLPPRSSLMPALLESFRFVEVS
jgi:hypothetical protein